MDLHVIMNIDLCNNNSALQPKTDSVKDLGFRVYDLWRGCEAIVGSCGSHAPRDGSFSKAGSPVYTPSTGVLTIKDTKEGAHRFQAHSNTDLGIHMKLASINTRPQPVSLGGARNGSTWPSDAVFLKKGVPSIHPEPVLILGIS